MSLSGIVGLLRIGRRGVFGPRSAGALARMQLDAEVPVIESGIQAARALVVQDERDVVGEKIGTLDDPGRRFPSSGRKREEAFACRNE